MEFFRWDDQYGVGVDEIDLQHQELFRILNKMVGMLGKGSKEEISALLDDMINYTSFHFQTEEKYYKDHPDFPYHKKEHDIFIKKNAKLRQSLKESDKDIGPEVMDFLLKWLKNHILKTDIRFFEDIK